MQARRPARFCIWLLALVWAQASFALDLAPGMAPLLISKVQALAQDIGTPPPDHSPWQTTTLPDRWLESRSMESGTVWYRVTASFDQIPAAPWALLLPKLSMNADFWINGVLVGRNGRMEDPLTRSWSQPLIFRMAPALWRVGDNVLHVRVKARGGDDGGLGRMWIGPAQPVEALYHARSFWTSTLVGIAVIFVFALGVLFLFIWARNAHEVHYGYFAFGTLLWGLANSNVLVSDAPLPEPVWKWIAHTGLIWGLLLVCLFGLRFGGVHRLRLEWAVFALAAITGLLYALAPEGWRQFIDLILLALVIALGVAAVVAVGRAVRKRPVHDHLLFSVAAAATLSMGAHDWLLLGGNISYERPYILPFVAPVLLGAMAWLVAGDFARAQKDLAQLNQELALRVERSERQLRESYARLGQSEREAAVMAERARILRDMHDGVGSHLSAAIRQIETGGVASGDVAQSLRDSLDQLKLSVDAVTLPPGDVNALLAAIRYRLQPRIQAAGLSLEWDVDALPQWTSGNANALRHLQYMLFEAFSNALQHAQAQRLRLSAHAAASSIVVSLSDDGRGFQVAPENALRSLRERARLIGAELSVDTGPEGSCVRVVLAVI